MKQFLEAAEKYVERYLADAWFEDENYDGAHISETVYVLAFDGAVKKGASFEEAGKVASQVASVYQN